MHVARGSAKLSRILNHRRSHVSSRSPKPQEWAWVATFLRYKHARLLVPGPRRRSRQLLRLPRRLRASWLRLRIRRPPSGTELQRLLPPLSRRLRTSHAMRRATARSKGRSSPQCALRMAREILQRRELGGKSRCSSVAFGSRLILGRSRLARRRAGRRRSYTKHRTSEAVVLTESNSRLGVFLTLPPHCCKQHEVSKGPLHLLSTELARNYLHLCVCLHHDCINEACFCSCACNKKVLEQQSHDKSLQKIKSKQRLETMSSPPPFRCGGQTR